MGTKTTEILLPDPLVVPAPVVVVESPSLLKKRFISLESLGAEVPPPAVFEGNPCHLTVIVEDLGELGLVLNYRLVLRGTPGFPNGIEIFRSKITAGVTGGMTEIGIQDLPHGLCMEPGERVELEVLADNGVVAPDPGADPTTARIVKVIASFCDYSNSIVRTKRTKLSDVYQDVFPSPPTGDQNSPISQSGGTPEFSFIANQPGSGGTSCLAQLDDEGTTAYLLETNPPDPSVGPFADGSAPLDHTGITLDEGQRVQMLAQVGDDVVVLTTWMQISTAD
jgi:hypothetical protein